MSYRILWPCIAGKSMMFHSQNITIMGSNESGSCHIRDDALLHPVLKHLCVLIITCPLRSLGHSFPEFIAATVGAINSYSYHRHQSLLYEAHMMQIREFVVHSGSMPYVNIQQRKQLCLTMFDECIQCYWNLVQFAWLVIRHNCEVPGADIQHFNCVEFFLQL